MPRPTTLTNSNTGGSDPGLHVGRPFWASDQTGLSTGPSSSQSPYLTQLDPRVSITSIATVGDTLPTADPNYAFSGILDGLGAFDNHDGTFTLLANHELRPGTGVERDHGADGAFVSRLVIDKKTLEVLSADDLIQTVHLYDDATGRYQATEGVQLNRLCSGDLPDVSAIFNTTSGKGYSEGAIFFSGEEADNGRAFAHIASGPDGGHSYELPWMGQMAFENIVARPGSGDKTVLVLTDDSTPGQVYVYIGEKQADGNPVERAGLVDGKLYAVKVADSDGGPLNEDRAAAFGAGADGDQDGNVDYRFSLVEVAGDPGEQIELMNEDDLEAESVEEGSTYFLRPEDGAWDPTDLDRFYFVTTDRFDQVKAGTGGAEGRSRLWGLEFDDLVNPESGGRLEMVLDGTEPHQMLDNMTVNDAGKVLLQEDPGGQNYLARVWLYDPAGDDLHALAQHDAARFTPGIPGFLTRDEESSGIIDLSDILGRGNKEVYLLDVQAHYSLGGALVEGGQLLAMEVDFRGDWLS